MGVRSAEKHLAKRRFWKKAKVKIFHSRKRKVKRKYLQEEFTKMGKLLATNWRGMMFQSGAVQPFGLREYEFSCSNGPAFSRPRQHNYFSCIRPATSFEDEECNINTTEDILQPCNFPAVGESATQTYEMGDGEKLGTPVSRSIEVRVDREADDFIARFRSQIKYEHQISLLEYEEMLARGT